MSMLSVNARLSSLEQDLGEYINIHGLSLYHDQIVGYVKTYVSDAIDSVSIKISPIDSILKLPAVGDSNTIYIETTNRQIYFWDNKYLKYYCYGSNAYDIEVIDCGTSKN